jgi:DNA-binding transcriptional ArsR family regulator
MNQKKILSFIKGVDSKRAETLKKLIEKEEEFEEKGNLYQEKFTPRQFELAIDPIIQTEYERARILELTSGKALSVHELSSILNLEKGKVLRHLIALKRRNMVAIEEVEGVTPRYKRID